MAIHSPPRDRPPSTRQPAGFTLIEVLVVVFIVGVLAAIFTLSVNVAGGADKEMRREADRLGQLVALGLEKATFETRELGLRFYPDRYEFSMRKIQDPGASDQDPATPGATGSGGQASDTAAKAGPKDQDTPREEWEVIPASEVLGGEKIPELFEFSLEIGGRPVDLQRSERDVAKHYEPQVFIFSSGDLSDDFVVHIRSRQDQRGYRLAVSQDGSSKLTPEGP